MTQQEWDAFLDSVRYLDVNITAEVTESQHDGREAGTLTLVATETDPTTGEPITINASRSLNGYPPAEQVRNLIHGFACHEADEHLWIGDTRPFDPHQG